MKMGLRVHAYSLNTQTAAAEKPRVQPGLHNKFKVNRGYTETYCFKKKKVSVN